MSLSQLGIRITTDQPIVMVDDSHDDFYIANRMYQRSELKNPFIHCDSAADLLSYLDSTRGEGSDSPALILMDINMPGMNGIEAVIAVRSKPEFTVTPIIAMLSSSLDPHDQKRALEAGATAYFPKPMNPVDYVAMFNSLLEGQPADQQP